MPRRDSRPPRQLRLAATSANNSESSELESVEIFDQRNGRSAEVTACLIFFGLSVSVLWAIVISVEVWSSGTMRKLATARRRDNLRRGDGLAGRGSAIFLGFRHAISFWF